MLEYRVLAISRGPHRPPCCQEDAMPLDPAAEFALPDDAARAVLAGRVWRPGVGPAVVSLRDGRLVDISRAVPTMRDLAEADDPPALAAGADGEDVGSLEAVLANTPRAGRDPDKPWLIAPNDLQAIKAAGVTFVVSMLERVIEEQARGQPERAVELRAEIGAAIGDDLSKLKPGSPEAMALKEVLIRRKMWSQYLEVGIGPDAEIFTKAQPLSAVGHLAEVGIHPHSSWNNPEPEVVLVVSSHGRIVGATLGNDVNLRDFEGRSALLLSKAKDNTASAAVGPFIRFFDDGFTLDDVRTSDLALTVEGEDGFRLDGASAMARISRDPADLVGQAIGPTHQYPDGFVLYLGTMFAPVQDRGAPGQGFTHRPGDIVTIASARLGRLANRVVHCPDAEPWTFGAGALMRNLAGRGLLG
jgi:fumarylacetoacetate (FAA) hydrolase family protein